jgi:hypothetical protein
MFSAGIFALLSERSFQAQFHIATTVKLCFGLLVAVWPTLLYVAALFSIVRDVRNSPGLQLKKAQDRE